jgi:hypothetical protein
MSVVAAERHIETEVTRRMGTFPKGYRGIFKTLFWLFLKVLGVYICETWSDEDIRLIALILRFPGFERD